MDWLQRTCLGVIVLSITGCSATHYPSHSWQTDPRGANDTTLFIFAQSLGGDGCIILDGKILYSWGSIDRSDDWASAVKPILSTLLFCALDSGLIQSPDDPIVRYGVPLTGKDTSITFRALGAMTSGYALNEPSGKAFAYNDYAIQLYQHTLFDHVFRNDPNTITNQLFKALHCEDPWIYAPNRRMSLSVRDFARIVWLWRNEGRWKGQQIVSRNNFRRYMKPQVRYDLPPAKPCESNHDILNLGSYGGGADQHTPFGQGVYGFNWWYNRSTSQNNDSLLFPSLPDDLIFALGVRGHLACFSPRRRYAILSSFGNWGPYYSSSWPWQRVDQLLFYLIAHIETEYIQK